jgi:glyoxylase-like metal-dependent hydrolase (beta-lactamase superfamily II)
MKQLSPGVYRWTAPHPEYRTSAEEVACYALTAPEGLALVDPLLPDGPAGDALLRQLDGLTRTAPRIDLLITIPYHTRSAEKLWRDWHETVETRIWGHPSVGKRFTDARTPLEHIDVGAPLGPLARAVAIGKPRRNETPLYFPSQRALAFGDTVVGMPDGSLRIWAQGRVEPTWYKERFLPTLQPLMALDVAHVLVTHGPAVVGRGQEALRSALAAPPVTRYW